MQRLYADMERCLHRLDELKLSTIALPLCYSLELLEAHMKAKGVKTPPKPLGRWTADDFDFVAQLGAGEPKIAVAGEARRKGRHRARSKTSN